MTHLRTTAMTFSAAAVLAVVAACNTASTTPMPETDDGDVASGNPVVSCDALTALALPNVTITAAETVAAGAFSPSLPEGRSLSDGQAQQYAALPAFCRVAATLTPSPDSDIKMEVWLPVEDWNGKLQAVGNGAFTGSLRHGGGRSMATGLARGYATASTDTGHAGGSAEFGYEHPEKVVDFGWRSVHEMTVTAKDVIAQFYGGGPEHAYWFGCSAGGRQALKEAQRFPEDYDGIIAGAPGNDWMGRAAGSLRVAKHLEHHEDARLPEAKVQLLHDAVLAACDAADGVEDRVVGDPERCQFDPGMLECSGAAGDDCLTAAQVATAEMMYASPNNPKTGRAITGVLPGSEPNWTDLGWTRSARATGIDQYRYLIHGDRDWTIDDFDFDADIVAAEEIDNDTLNALDPNLRPFLDSGGKLLAYHGWADAQISPANATQYYDRVLETVADEALVRDGFRLFMAPGMGHCAGGEGPNAFDALTVMEEWVEQGNAPDQIIASRTRDGAVDRTRPLCPYPQRAVYSGTGSTDDAENFVCQAP
ncbi:MAG: tannase/feruloyl esterase family alpha/beta hydrolase [Vicinamibacterales bacterium]|nr:tannase/feruloyl esterase family alpha/beta hydrolase [Vicinamibacterales bacterium]